MDDLFWVCARKPDGSVTTGPCSLVSDEGEMATFKEHGTRATFQASMDSIVGSVSNPHDIDNVPDDLVESDEVSETAVLWAIKTKFKQEVIYTNIGSILIAVNPYRVLDGLYEPEIMEMYCHEATTLGVRGGESNTTSPHIWGIARDAYVQLAREDGKRQAIVISGESGAGKTEAAKKVMTFLSEMSMAEAGAPSSPGSGAKGADRRASVSFADSGAKEALETRVLMTNPLLESFGNAKTARNDNSSRFGKWLEILFDIAGAGGRMQVRGARITHYLLEKSRVVSQARGERNFHIFYQLFNRRDLKLGSPSDYAYLNGSGCTTIKDVNDMANGKQTMKSLADLNVSSMAQVAVLELLKGILCLGNIDMAAGQNDEVACKTAATMWLHSAAKCLCIDSAALERALTRKVLVLGGEQTEVLLTEEQAVDTRNILSKELYSRIFAFIVEASNTSLMDSVGDTDEGEKPSSIGLLDIFGFEIFAVNSLEQLSINFANEKLQQYFLHYVLKREQLIYTSEGIDCERIVPKDNQDVLDLFEAPRVGIFSRLDEEVRLPRGDDAGFLRKVVADRAEAAEATEKSGDGDDNEDEGEVWQDRKEVVERFRKDIKMAENEFSIVHFAGAVTYASDGFVEKNKNRLYSHLEELLATSTSAPVRTILGADSDSAAAVSEQGSKTTLVSGFQGQLQGLIKVLNESSPHFVRCIKPNDSKSKTFFDEAQVLEQLQYSGVLEAIQIRKQGYPVRRTHQEFYGLYRGLCHASKEDLEGDELPLKDKCELMVGNLQEEAESSEVEAHTTLFTGHIIIGTKSVFFRQPVLRYLEVKRYDLWLAKLPRVQTFGRMAVAKRRVRFIRDALGLLDELIEASKEHGGFNYTVHDDLVDLVRHCDIDLRMPLHTQLVSAMQRVRDLEEVKSVVDQADKLSQEQGGKHGGDVVAEFELVERVLEKMAKYGFTGPNSPSVEVNRLYAYREDIAPRALLVKRFRKAIDDVAEDELQMCLALVEQARKEDVDVSDKGGRSSPVEFCRDESMDAQMLLKEIAADRGKLSAAFELCKAKVAKGDDAFQGGAHSTELIHFSSSLVETLTAFDEAEGGRVPISPAMGTMVNLMLRISYAFEKWRAKQWDLCAQEARDMRAAMDSFVDSVDDVSNPGKRLPLSLKDPYEQEVRPFVMTLLHFMVPQIEQNYILPILAEGVNDGGIVPTECPLAALFVDPRVYREGNRVPGDLKYATINCSDVAYENLETVVKDTRAMEVGSDDGLAMLPMLAALAQVRKCIKHGDCRGVLRQVCDSLEYAEWEDNHRALLKRLSDPDIPLESLESFVSTPSPADSLPFTQFEDLSRFKNEFFNASSLSMEFKEAKNYALVQLNYSVLAISVRVGAAIESENGEVEPAHVHHRTLDAIIACDDFRKAATSISDFIKLVELLREMRILLERGGRASWLQVVAMKESDSWVEMHLDTLGSSVSASERTPFFQCVKAVHDELRAIIKHCTSNILEEDLRSAFVKGCYNGQADSISFAELEQVMGDCPMHTDLTTKCSNLATVGNLLLSARKLFSKSDLDSAKAKAVCDELSAFLSERVNDDSLSSAASISSVASTEGPSADSIVSKESRLKRRKSTVWIRSVGLTELVSELDHMHADIDFYECLLTIEDCLRMPSPVNYVIPMETSSSPDADAEGGDNNSKGDDRLPQPPSGRAASVTPLPPRRGPTPADPSYLVASDGMALNMKVLDTARISDGLTVAREATKFVKNLMPKHLRIIRCAEIVKKMRDNVRIGNWNEAYAAFNSIKEDDLLTALPIVQAEVVGAADTIQNYYVISVCRKALSSGYARGRIGLVDPNKISVAKLDDAMTLCANIGCSNPRAEALRDAVMLISDLRQAQQIKNWSTISEVMGKLADAGIGDQGGVTECCYEEVRWAKIEKDNHDSIESINHALLKEAIAHKDSQMDVGGLKVELLQAAYTKAQTIKEKYRGVVLVELLSIADIVLKARKAVQQTNWFALNSLVTLWKAEVEEFRLQIDNLELDDTSLARGNSILRKSSMLAVRKGSNNDQEDAGLTPQRSKKFDFWTTFAPVKETMERELLYIDQHFSIQELELQINSGLRQGGMVPELIGEVDTAKIDVDGIKASQEKRHELEGRGMVLNSTLRAAFSASDLILKLRTMILEDQWEDMSAVLEEAMTTTSVGLHSSVPEICRKEMECIRYETENRWIISSVEEAIRVGGVQGEIDDLNIEHVSYEHLLTCIRTCRDMTPRTDKARGLVFAADTLVTLRKTLVRRPVVWSTVLDSATQILRAEVVLKLDAMVLPEVRLVEAAANDKLLCALLIKALTKNGPVGYPGALNLDTTLYSDLEQAIAVATKEGVRSIKASQLLTSCKDIMSLRKAVLMTRDEDKKVSKDAWVSLRSIVTTLFQRNHCDEDPREPGDSAKNHAKGPGEPKLGDQAAASSEHADALKIAISIQGADSSKDKGGAEAQQADAGWLLCKDEVNLISKDAHVEEVYRNLVANINKSLLVYEARSKIPCEPLDDKQSIAMAVKRTPDLNGVIKTESLSKILDYARNLKFGSLILEGYIKTCSILLSVRKAIVEENWRALREGPAYSPESAGVMKRIPEGLEELECAKREYQTGMCAQILEDAIKKESHVHLTDDQGHTTVSATDTKHEKEVEKRRTEILMDFCSVHGVSTDHVNVDPNVVALHSAIVPFRNLYRVIRIVKLSNPSYAMVQQLLECSVRVFQLRVGFHSGDNDEVSEALSWLRSNSARSPIMIQSEAKAAYIDHKNDLLKGRISAALMSGRAKSRYSDLIGKGLIVAETEDLKSCIDSSKEDEKSLTREVKSLVEAAENVLVLRKALNDGNMVGLYNYLETMALYNRTNMRNMHSSIIDEVHTLINILHNEISITALKCALLAFAVQSHKELPEYMAILLTEQTSDASFLNIVGNVAFQAFKQEWADIEMNGSSAYPDVRSIVTETTEGDTTANANNEGPRAVESYRHYSYDNMHRTDVDTTSIEVALLDEALEIAKQKGVYSDNAKRLLHTVLMIRKLRLAMKRQEWHFVEDMLVRYGIERFKSTADVESFGPQSLPPSLDRACTLEVNVIQHQLEMRAAIQDVLNLLHTGMARCSNGVVKTISIEVIPLERAVQRCYLSINEVSGEDPKDAIGKEGEIQEESAQGRLRSLLQSASVIVKVRKLLMSGDLQEAGELAAAAMSITSPACGEVSEPRVNLEERTGRFALGDRPMHEAVKAELQLYVTELHSSLKLVSVISDLQEGIATKNYDELEELIDKSRSLMVQKGLRLDDLGLVRTFQRAQMVHKTMSMARKALLKSMHSYDTAFIRAAIENAEKLRLKEDDVVAARLRMSNLAEFEDYTKSLAAPEGGIASTSLCMHKTVAKARDLDLVLHPAALEAEVAKHLNYSSLRKLHVAKSLCLPSDRTFGVQVPIVHTGEGRESAMKLPSTVPTHAYGSPFVAATHTMRLKRAYLLQKQVRKQYDISKFPPLRDPQMFSIRMGVENEALMANMLVHQDTNLPTSITKLRPELAALAVWTFSHNIKGLEKATFTRVEVKLRDMCRLGRQIPTIRDEIVLQVVKQLTQNPSADASDRLWRTLAAFLAHFPPSSLFENYLESHLLSVIEDLEQAVSELQDEVSLERDGHLAKVPQASLVRSGLTTDSMAPTEVHKKKLNTEEKELIHKNTNKIIVARTQISWARHCVRLLHEACFLYGYDQPLLKAFDDSLHRFSLWLTESQAAVMFLRCQAPLLAEDITEEVCEERIYKSRPSSKVGGEARSGTSSGDAKRNKEKSDKALAKALARVFDDPGWSDTVDTRTHHSEATLELASSRVSEGIAPAIDANVNETSINGKNREGATRESLYMQSTSLTHLSKSAFHAGRSAFEGANSSTPARGDSNVPASASGAASSGTLIGAFRDPANRLIGEDRHILGSAKFWMQKFNSFVDSQTLQGGKDTVEAAKKKSEVSTAKTLFGELDSVNEALDEEHVGKEEKDADSAPVKTHVSKGYPFLVIDNDDFTSRICSISEKHTSMVNHVKAIEDSEAPDSGEGRAQPSSHFTSETSLEGEIINFLVCGNPPTNTQAALRLHNYLLHNGELSSPSPFFSEEENERSAARRVWLKENISVPPPIELRDPVHWTHLHGNRDGDNGEKAGSMGRTNGLVSEARAFWEGVIIPVCDTFPLELPSQEEEKKKKAQEELKEAKAESQIKDKMAARNATQKTRRQSEIAQNYLNSVIAQQALDATARESAGIDMRLFRDLVYVGISMYHDLLIEGQKDRAKLQKWNESDEIIRSRDVGGSGSSPISSVMSGLEQQINPKKRFSHYHTTTVPDMVVEEKTPEGLQRRKATVNPTTKAEGQTNTPFAD